jgi:hypothetical protein
MTWLAIGGFLKSLASGIGAWLSRRSLAELGVIALAILFVIQHFALVDARHDAAKWQKQFNAEHAKLEAISSKRDTQKQTTAENVKVVTRVIHDADGRAKVVEQAPIPPTDCHGVTPSGVLQADV